MQNKILPPVAGDSTLYQKEAVQFVLKKCPAGQRVNMRWVSFFLYLARNPQATTDHFRRWNNQPQVASSLHYQFGADFLNNYAAAPDLAAALLHFLRKKFSALEKSKAGRLKIYIATTIAHKWQQGFGAKPDACGMVMLRDLQDGELATAFQKSKGGCVVGVEDVVKARREVARMQIEAKKFLARHVDKNGYIFTKGRN